MGCEWIVNDRYVPGVLQGVSNVIEGGIVYVSICQKGWCGMSIVGRMFSMFWCVKYRC